MKSKLFAYLAVLCTALGVVAQTSTITYQGQLSSGGNAANGAFDLQFTLFDAATAGSPVGVVLTNAPVIVSNGLFTATLDFGSEVFDGSPRWLEIGVRSNGSTNSFAILSPRQLLTATPYAIRAVNFSGPLAATNLTGKISDANLSPNVALLTSNANFTGTVTASNFSGNASGLVNLPATNLSGTIAEARLPMSIIAYGAMGGANDDTAAFQAALSSGKEVWLQPTNYTIYSTLYVSNNSRLIGRGATLVFHSSASGEMINTTTATNWVLQDMSLVGGTNTDLITVQGNRIGLRAGTDTGGTVQGLRFQGWNKYAINLFGLTGITYGNITRTHFQNLNIAYGYMGFFTEAPTEAATAEYVNLSGWYIHSCHFGGQIASGNIYFTDSMVNNCIYGIYVHGGGNNAHGLVDGLSLNHNDVPIYCHGVYNGMLFNNCVIIANRSGGGFNGAEFEIRLYEAIGVTVQNCLLGYAKVVCDRGALNYTNGGNFIKNNTHARITYALTNGGRVEESGNTQWNSNADPLSAGRNAALWQAYDPYVGYAQFANWGSNYLGLWLGKGLTNNLNGVTLLGGNGANAGNTHLNADNEMFLSKSMIPWAHLRSDRGLILGDVAVNQTSPGANNVRINGSLTVAGNLTGNVPYVRLQDEQTSGTNGGTSAANTWATRTLNTKYDDSINVVLTDTNTFILPPGTYRIYATAPVVGSGPACTRLFNVTSNAVTLSGTSEYTPPGAGQRIPVAGLFTIANTNTFRIEQNVQQATATWGYGMAGGFGTEIYTQVELFKQR